MLNRSDTPWYQNNTKLFRQPKPGDWKSVIETIVEELKKLIGVRNGTIAPNQTPNKPQQQIINTIIERTSHSTLQLELELLNKLFDAKAQSLKGLPVEDHEAFIREIKAAYRLHKLQTMIQKEIFAYQEPA